MEQGADDLKEAVEQAGFDRHAALVFGNEDGFQVEVYECDDPVGVEGPDGPAEAEFLAIVNTPFRFYAVFVEGLPSLVQLMGELRPMIASELQTIRLEDRRERRR